VTTFAPAGASWSNCIKAVGATVGASAGAAVAASAAGAAVAASAAGAAVAASAAAGAAVGAAAAAGAAVGASAAGVVAPPQALNTNIKVANSASNGECLNFMPVTPLS
jgi:hypothetical protein